MKLIWSPRAIRHLMAIRKYIEKDSDATAAFIANVFWTPSRFFGHSLRWGGPGGWPELGNLWCPELPMSFLIEFGESDWSY